MNVFIKNGTKVKVGPTSDIIKKRIVGAQIHININKLLNLVRELPLLTCMKSENKNSLYIASLPSTMVQPILFRSATSLFLCASVKGVAACNTSEYLKVWSTVKIRGTRVPQKAKVPVGRPRPYSIIILNMRFIPKASLRASSQITASSYILERHLWVNNSKPFARAPTWSLACKQTDCITAVMWKLLDPSLYWHPVNRKHFYDFTQCWINVEDVGRRCINVIQMSCVCWAGGLSLKHCTFIQCWVNVGPALQTSA